MSTSRDTVAASTPNGAVALPKRNLINQNEPPRPVWSLEPGPQTPGGSSEVPLGESTLLAIHTKERANLRSNPLLSKNSFKVRCTQQGEDSML